MTTCDCKDYCKGYSEQDRECTTKRFYSCMVRFDRISRGLWTVPTTTIETVVNEDHIEAIKQQQERI